MNTCEVLGGRVVAADKAVVGVVVVAEVSGMLRDRTGAVTDGVGSDGGRVADAVGGDVVVVASGGVAGDSTVQTQTVTRRDVTDRAATRDRTVIGLYQSLVEAFSASDGATTLPRVEIVSERLYASDRGIHNAIASSKVQDSAIGRGKAVLGGGEEPSETITARDAVIARRVVSVLTSDAASTQDTSRVAVGSQVETVTAQGVAVDSMTPRLFAAMTAACSAVAADRVSFRNPALQTWCFNTTTAALSAWLGADMQSLAYGDRQTLAAGVDGVYVLDGEDDDGSHIDSGVSWGFTDFSSSAMKRIDNMYVGYNSKGLLKLRLGVQDSNYSPQEYMLERRPTNAPRTTRVTPGKGQWGRYWQTSIDSVDGSDFRVTDMEVDVAVSNRRV